MLANRTVEILMAKYMYRPVNYERIMRIESSPYPEPAIREAVMNAIIHNDYSSHVDIQIKVNPKDLTIYNEGGLPIGWTLEKLIGSHKSVPRNPGLATAFYRAGLIESFGRGIGKIMAQFEGRDVPMPEFEFDSGFAIRFFNEVNARSAIVPDVSEGPEKIIVDYLVANGKGTYYKISESTNISLRQVQRLAKKLVDTDILKKDREGKTVVLSINAHKD